MRVTSWRNFAITMAVIVAWALLARFTSMPWYVEWPGVLIISAVMAWFAPWIGFKRAA